MADAYSPRMEPRRKRKTIDPEREALRAQQKLVHADEAKALLAIWRAYKHGKKSVTQASIGEDFDIGGQGMVSHYLHGKDPLNLACAAKFAKGFGVYIQQFSPRLAALAEEAANYSRPDVVVAKDDRERTLLKTYRKLDQEPKDTISGSAARLLSKQEELVATEQERYDNGKSGTRNAVNMVSSRDGRTGHTMDSESPRAEARGDYEQKGSLEGYYGKGAVDSARGALKSLPKQPRTSPSTGKSKTGRAK